MSLEAIPELQELDSQRGLVRIPPQIDVPLTPRVRRLIDTPHFQRLARISQLGLVAQVYPAAHHSRFEHSLGVYRMALLYLRRLGHDPRFTAVVGREAGELFLAAALLHDLGHWPFCHPLEDIRLPGVPRHEAFAEAFLLEGEIAEALREDWRVDPADLLALLCEKRPDPASRLLRSMLSGPIDVDKMDYLVRDSLHAGVPYGLNFDQPRLIGSLCLNEAGDGLAISEKGRTAAELLVFARYVMFSEVYWHHAVRAATAMLQRAFFELHGCLELDTMFRLSEEGWISAILAAAALRPEAELLDGLFGKQRRLYKRAAQFSFFQERDLYEQLAQRPYPWLVDCSRALTERLAEELGEPVARHEVLIDAPPVKREVEFDIEIHFPKEGVYRRLGDVSPVVETLARRQFDDYVKRVRIFVHPRLAAMLQRLQSVPAAVEQALDRVSQTK